LTDARLPTEVELVYDVMPCNALRTAQEPLGQVHPCTYFRKWGTYHSYDYEINGAPPQRGIVQKSVYVGRAALVPEVLSGCRKAPIMALGINPNLPAWWPRKRNTVFPLFDDYRQYAHYFRYRAVAKLEIPEADYERFGGGTDDTPFSNVELDVPANASGQREIPVQLQPQQMYEVYQGLLDTLAATMAWPEHELTVGEDLAYGNMVASPSAKWTTNADPNDPTLPPMTATERDGIVAECFDKRRYFLRQLFQSLPAVLLVFSQATANALIGELGSAFSTGDPKVGEPLDRLLEREIRFSYGTLAQGKEIDARVIFAPHATGNPQEWAAARERVVEQLVAEARRGSIAYDAKAKHLVRPPGLCVLCPMLEIGACDYAEQLRPISDTPTPAVAADAPATHLQAEKDEQSRLLAALDARRSSQRGWQEADDANEPLGVRER
jgi:hypothetical protein